MATTKPRQDLRSKFVRNAIPTEQDFKDLIDAQLNQKDDGIFRNTGEPLSIVAGTDPQKRAIQLYGDDTGAAPDWLISLNPGQDPSNPRLNNRRGFGIATADGTTRLFIGISGNVGIGTTNPPQKLSIAGGLNIDQLDANDNTLANGLRFGQGASGEGIASKRTASGNQYGLDFYTQSKTRLSLTNGGAVGIGTTTPADQLDVIGRIRAGALTIGPWPANPENYAFIGSNQLDQTNGGNYALLVGTGAERGVTLLNSPTRIGFRIGNEERMTFPSSGPLQVNGDLQATGAFQGLMRARGNGPVLRLEGNDHCYMEWWPDGPGRRRGWLGYGDAGSEDLRLWAEGSSLTIGAARNAANQQGRLHLHAEELLFLLGRDGVIVSRAWGGGGNLSVDGNVSVGGKLQFGNEGGNKIVLYDNGPANSYGFGLNGGNLNAFVPAGGRFSVRQNGFDGQEVLTIPGSGLEIRLKYNSNEGPRLLLENPGKPGLGKEWAIYNMTGSYGNSLQFWNYGGDGWGSKLSLKDNGQAVFSGIIGTNGYDPNGSGGSFPRVGSWGMGVHTLDVVSEGSIWCANYVYCRDASVQRRDLAENYFSTQGLAAGDVVSLDQHADEIVISERPGDPRLVGIISSEPGLLLGSEHTESSDNTEESRLFPVALCGRVPCKVSDENGPIARGDLLTSSSTPGHAMKAIPTTVDGVPIHAPGTILGKALKSHKAGIGLIEVFVTLQ
jgi:hypothetical protein